MKNFDFGWSASMSVTRSVSGEDVKDSKNRYIPTAGSMGGQIAGGTFDFGTATSSPMISNSGTIYQTGNLQKYTIHLRDKQSGQMYEEFFGKILNSNTIGIEVIGNYNEDTKSWDPLTSQQQIATAALVNELMYRYNLEIHQVMTHEGVQRKTKGEGQTVLDAIKEDIK